MIILLIDFELNPVSGSPADARKLLEQSEARHDVLLVRVLRDLHIQSCGDFIGRGH